MNTSNTLLKYLAELIILDNSRQVKKDPSRSRKEVYEKLITADQEYIDKLVTYFNTKYATKEVPEAHP
jgi:hypothetical protein